MKQKNQNRTSFVVSFVFTHTLWLVLINKVINSWKLFHPAHDGTRCLKDPFMTGVVSVQKQDNNHM